MKSLDHSRAFSVALVGPDGSGKTTIARRLEQAFPHRLKYLYMGINSESSNVALPTTRIVQRLKRLVRTGSSHEKKNPIARASRGPLWSTLRTANVIAEETFRLSLSWIYKKQGWIVVYDRYFKFDFACDPGKLSMLPFSERMHRYWLSYFHPYPELTIFLEAPPQVLFRRKQEGGVEWLRERQRAILQEGQALRNFIRIDAGRPLDTVYDEVECYVIRFAQSFASGTTPPSPETNHASPSSEQSH
jgi:thymidylate kinase